MATLQDLDASVTNLKTQVDALVARVGVATVPETDLDAVKAQIDQLAAEAQTAATPPA